MEFEIKKMEVELYILNETAKFHNELIKKVETLLDLDAMDKTTALAFAVVMREMSGSVTERALELKSEIENLK